MGTTKRFKKGQRCYTPEGLAVEYVGPAPGGHLALSVYVDDDGAEWPEDDTPRFFRALHAKPRTQALAKEVQELGEEIARRRAELDGIESKLAEHERAQNNMRKRFSQYAALQRIDDWLSGRMTHFVMVSEYGDISVWERDALLSDEQDRPDTRLVCLFGNSNGDLQWRVNRWRDGSGNWRDCVPCGSEREARELAAQAVQQAWASDNEYRRRRATQSALKMGLEVPTERLQEIRGREIAEAQKAVREATERLEIAQAALRKAQTA